MGVGPQLCELRDNGVLRSSHSGDSRKFAFKEFSEVSQEFIGDSSPLATVVALVNFRRD